MCAFCTDVSAKNLAIASFGNPCSLAVLKIRDAVRLCRDRSSGTTPSRETCCRLGRSANGPMESTTVRFLDASQLGSVFSSSHRRALICPIGRRLVTFGRYKIESHSNSLSSDKKSSVSSGNDAIFSARRRRSSAMGLSVLYLQCQTQRLCNPVGIALDGNVADLSRSKPRCMSQG